MNEMAPELSPEEGAEQQVEELAIEQAQIASQAEGWSQEQARAKLRHRYIDKSRYPWLTGNWEDL